MTRFWLKNSKYFKFTLAALLGLFMLLSFSIYYIADKGAIEHKYATSLKMLIKPEVGVPTFTMIDLNTKLAALTTFELVKTIPATIDADGYNKQLLTSLLIFSIISIPVVIIQLSIGTNKNIILSLVINIITTTIMLVLFGLIIATISELHLINKVIVAADKLYTAQKHAVLKSLKEDLPKYSKVVLAWA